MHMVKVVTKNPSALIDEALNIGQHNWDAPDHLALGQLSMQQLFPTLAIEAPAQSMPLPRAENSLNIDTLNFADPLRAGHAISGEQLLNRRLFNDALLVMHKQKVVHESYRNGMQAGDRHVIHSCTKSLCSMLVAMAIDEGKLDPARQVRSYLNSFATINAWQGVTVQHAWDMQAGIAYSEDYQDPDADYWSYARAAGYYPPRSGEQAIGVKAWVYNNLNRRHCEPGTRFVYNSTLTNVLGLILEEVYETPLAELFEQKLYQKVGCEQAGFFNTDPQGFPITEGQLNLHLQDFARCAYPMLNQGRNLADQRILPAGFIDDVVTPSSQAQQAYQADSTDSQFIQGQYKQQFWVLEPAQQRFCMLGIHGQFAWYDLRRELMIVGLGSYPKQDGPLMMKTLQTLWEGIAAAVN